MKPHRMILGVVLAAWPGLAAPPATAADDLAKGEAAKASAMVAEELKHWTIRTTGGRPQPLAPRPDPILRYSNPGVGRVYGDVCLFTEGGRPGAILVIYKWFSPYQGFEAETHSLAATGLSAERDGKAVWQPDGAGLERNDVPDAPAPAATHGERSAQLRAIAGDFSARLLDARVNKAGEEQALRLLTRPLYRDEPRGEPARDDALFTFVLGTDPEVFLLVETAETPRGRRWRYGLARMNRDPLRVLHKGREVWRVGRVDPHRDSHAAYWSMELPQ